MFLLFSVLVVCVVCACYLFLFVVLLCLCSAFVSVSVCSFVCWVPFNFLVAGPPVLVMGGLKRTYYWGVGGFMGGPLGSSHFDSFGTLF